jgi:hypothetical protein
MYDERGGRGEGLGVDGQGWDPRVGTTFIDTKKKLLMLKPVTP